MLAAVAAGAMVLTPAFAATSGKKRPPAVALSFDPVSSFTPANADPKLAAALGATHGLSLTDFKFTPAPAKGRPSQVRVAIRARASTPSSSQPLTLASAGTATSLAPSTYNLGVAVGWRRFAVAGDVSKSKDINPAMGGHETAVVGVSYSLNNRLSTRVAVGADRMTSPIAALRRGDNVSVDAGASYALSRRIAVTGGVRYNVERDRASAVQDNRRDSQAVYVGTAFKF